MLLSFSRRCGALVWVAGEFREFAMRMEITSFAFSSVQIQYWEGECNWYGIGTVFSEMRS